MSPPAEESHRPEPPFRIGSGYDIHRFAKERPLVLGGISIPSPLGLEGHSDADVLTHALADALLGSIGDGDIGIHFSNTDPSIEGIDSQIILAFAAKKVRQRGYQIGNLDAMIIAEFPKLSPHLPEIREKLARTLEINPSQISVKATTNEGLGALGAGLGMAAQASCLIYRLA
ncbi:MAG: 2-C-methyl-D-erythritol 2,4-cyclodiphosphate synthase [Puniceicoccaceae bacterium]